MSAETTKTDERTPAQRWVITLALEVLIGVALAVVLIAAAWASSNAIRFVYGGY